MTRDPTPATARRDYPADRPRLGRPRPLPTLTPTTRWGRLALRLSRLFSRR